MSKRASSAEYDLIERINRDKYDRFYDISAGSIQTPGDSKEYFSRLVKARLALIREHGTNKTVLDLCCGTGDYLLESRGIIEKGAGIDFSVRMIQAATSKKASVNARNVAFAVSSARCIPFAEDTFDLVYSFSSLYYVPAPERVISEVARVLKRSSIAIMEFGNIYSLNTLVCEAYSELAVSCHVRTGRIRQAIAKAGLKAQECRRFQILPLWGDRPAWLRPLLHPGWKRLLERVVGKRTLDEALCEIPILRRFCFRQMFICRKM